MRRKASTSRYPDRRKIRVNFRIVQPQPGFDHLSQEMLDIAMQCRGLTRSFGDGDGRVAALRGVDLDVRMGELLIVSGPSGCGKTTLLSILGTLLAPDAGTCEVLGHDLGQLDEEARGRLRARSIGFVFQSFNLLPALTAAENVSLPLLLNGVPQDEATVKASDMLVELGLGDRGDHLPRQLSGGQQQRVAIARALVHQPQVVICDEPTSSLDAQAGQATMQLLHDVARAPDRALVLVTHDARTFAYADRIAHMEDGRILSIETNRRTPTA